MAKYIKTETIVTCNNQGLYYGTIKSQFHYDIEFTIQIYAKPIVKPKFTIVGEMYINAIYKKKILLYRSTTFSNQANGKVKDGFYINIFRVMSDTEHKGLKVVFVEDENKFGDVWIGEEYKDGELF